MNSETLELLTKELARELAGSRMGKVFQLSRSEIAIDLRLAGSNYLYVNFTPSDPRLHLISRRLKDLERSSGNPSPFSLTLRKRLSNGEVIKVSRRPDERILDIAFHAEDELGIAAAYSLVVQLTGRSANLFLVDDAGIIIDRSRDTSGHGQQIGEAYSPPVRESSDPKSEKHGPADAAAASSPARPSAALDAFYSELAAGSRFRGLARAANNKISSELKKREKLIGKMKADLVSHGDPGAWKRFGDLLLANSSTAGRTENAVLVTDYFDENAPEISIPVDANDSLTEAAEKYYRKYTKARNGAAEIAARIDKLSSELSILEKRKEEIAQAVEEEDAAVLEAYLAEGKRAPVEKPRGKTLVATPSARSFVSTDGFEILVGKKAKDNDILTFKVAKSLDTWMHAADYPGSHVVIRNPNRKEIPHQTLTEAAKLAAFYSQGKAQTKAAVHYTLKKFVNKPKGSAPGLVSLASFKTILVVPEFPEALTQKD